MRTATGTWVVLGVTLAFASTAAAQPEAAEQHVEAAEEAVPDEDLTSWQLSLGGVLQTGNTRAYTLTGGSLLEIVRGRHGFAAEAQGNYGAAVVEDSEDYAQTAQNVRLRLRYDFFLTRLDALFLATQLRHDPFAGLDYRYQAQTGYARYFIREEKHRFWGEIGYDLTYDNYDPDPLLDPDTMRVLDGSEVLHSARLFVGYHNAVSDNLEVRTGLEGLANVQDASDVRINWDNALRAKMADRLQLEVKFLLQFDNEPVPGNESLDTTTQLNVIYNVI